ncbi:PDZ domain-containing protein [Hydrogenibacillus schlegelii]|uniref:Cell division topological determinant MinJ n=2 Tax=Hydrogenibacillus schlegelii TaxID=1484 RepID=A0A179IPD3_HYDSH|nr:PDZ domain-containing protein [Hydrogenibacillus schlegelii]MBT9281216.1 PDZ domain-containing protein [Hydrogenibacillus schlegelii]OAR03570.1 hypothetical protein SA87_02750 [Hydrogenibacillus schlegelii]PTQ54234.1 MAG: Cell division topological determinant MinJ [Hydrogenibacillus schlegelii]
MGGWLWLAAVAVWAAGWTALAFRWQKGLERRTFGLRLEAPLVRMGASLRFWLTASAGAAGAAVLLPPLPPPEALLGVTALSLGASVFLLPLARPAPAAAVLAAAGSLIAFAGPRFADPSAPPEAVWVFNLLPKAGSVREALSSVRAAAAALAATAPAAWLALGAAALAAEGVALGTAPAGLYAPYATRTARGGVETGRQLVLAWGAPLWGGSGPLPVAGVSVLRSPGAVPGQARRQAARRRLGGAALLGLLAWAAWAAPATPADGLAAAVLLAFVDRWSGRPMLRMKAVRPDDAGGLVVLATVPGSPARRLGIRPGWRVLEVNRRPVRTADDVYFALRAQPYARFVLLDERGERLFRESPRYAGAPHLFGLIFAPPAAPAIPVPKTVFGLLRLPVARPGRPTEQAPAEEATI